MTQLPGWFEVTSLVVILAILVVDLAVIGRRPHVPTFTESARWVGVYVGLALVFAGLVWVVGGPAPAGEFVAGWLTEYSLSLDNLFVFALILGSFAVPRALQQGALMIGILIALVLRAALILAGAAIIDRFTAVFYLFGAILVVTAVSMLRADDVEEYRENLTIRLVRRVMPVSTEFDGRRLVTRIDGRKLLTPMALVILSLGTTDLLFALDSIPAIFGLTTDPFIVFTTNIFALMGLRQLYFMLGGLMERLAYLKYGLAAVLAFIGVKLVLEALHTNRLPFINHGEPVGWAPEIATWVSLVVIAGCLGVAGLVSVLKPPRQDAPA
ncbi:TerC/Alx family metal homeostasis membrane protein [Miniimonas sp. S16]|uniref:TerC/Alx family metal homeostasis membrane protein n=1 Tax=Miniimonas sp. S16 TaxID=2171623 RepID=UPI000D526CF5|nr:TerC/Alx family metal homeostasis membrane protein [Miniimonas sp. S16]